MRRSGCSGTSAPRFDPDESSTQEKVRDYAVGELGDDGYAEAEAAGAALSLDAVAVRVGVVLTS